MQEVLGAILAGGASSRMGRDKATLRLRDGRTMIECVAAALREALHMHQIVIVGGAAIPGLDSDLDTMTGILRVEDLRWGVGPLAGIESLLTSGLANQYLVCPCDLPNVTAALLRTLLQQSAAPATVIRLAGGDVPDSLPARVAASALPVVSQLLDEGVRSVWRLMEVLPASVVEIDAAFASALRNVNTPDDFSKA